MRTELPTSAAATSSSGKNAARTAEVAKASQETQVAVAAEKAMRQAQPQDANAAVRAAAQQIDSYLKSVGRQVEFRVDEETGTTVVTVRETATGDVIRQIPNEEVLELARRFAAGSGSLLNLTV